MPTQKVLNYLIYKIIEEGTYGKVYKARNLLTDEECAVKMYCGSGDISNLRKEYDILSQLDHANIIKCKGYFEQNDHKNNKQGYLVMERGTTDMFEYISKKLDVVEYINYIFDIIKGLEYLHGKNIVHGDIKLENIVLVDNTAKIVDFGLSVQLTETTASVNLMGTKGMIAPEIRIRGICCLASDIWAIGKLMQNVERELIRDGFLNYPRMSFLFMQCFEHEHRLRPTIGKLKEMFRERYQDILYDVHMNNHSTLQISSHFDGQK